MPSFTTLRNALEKKINIFDKKFLNGWILFWGPRLIRLARSLIDFFNQFKNWVAPLITARYVVYLYSSIQAIHASSKRILNPNKSHDDLTFAKNKLEEVLKNENTSKEDLNLALKIYAKKVSALQVNNHYDFKKVDAFAGIYIFNKALFELIAALPTKQLINPVAIPLDLLFMLLDDPIVPSTKLWNTYHKYNILQDLYHRLKKDNYESASSTVKEFIGVYENELKIQLEQELINRIIGIIKIYPIASVALLSYFSLLNPVAFPAFATALAITVVFPIYLRWFVENDMSLEKIRAEAEKASFLPKTENPSSELHFKSLFLYVLLRCVTLNLASSTTIGTFVHYFDTLFNNDSINKKNLIPNSTYLTICKDLRIKTFTISSNDEDDQMKNNNQQHPEIETTYHSPAESDSNLTNLSWWEMVNPSPLLKN